MDSGRGNERRDAKIKRKDFGNYSELRINKKKVNIIEVAICW